MVFWAPRVEASAARRLGAGVTYLGALSTDMFGEAGTLGLGPNGWKIPHWDSKWYKEDVDTCVDV